MLHDIVNHNVPQNLATDASKGDRLAITRPESPPFLKITETFIASKDVW